MTFDLDKVAAIVRLVFTTDVEKHRGYWVARVMVEEETAAGRVGRIPIATVRGKTRRVAVDLAMWAHIEADEVAQSEGGE